MEYRRSKLLIILFLVMALLLVGCSEGEVGSDDSTEPAAKENEVVSSKDLPKGVVAHTEFAEHYPLIVEAFERNNEMEATTYGGSEPYSYLETYPYTNTFYKGYVFEHEYNRARGHTYILDDVIEIARPKVGATCLSCKISDYQEAVNADGSVASMDFDEFVENHVETGFTCYDCHGEEPGVVHTNRIHLTQAVEMGGLEDVLEGNLLACAQCHVEYYFLDDLNVALPWANGLGCDEAYKYYQAIEHHDWEHPLTGAKVLKAQHPEVETFHGSVHDKIGADCLTCHMPEIEIDGEKITSHHWTSPLKYPKESCLTCHSNQDEESIIKLAEAVQKPVVEATHEIGQKLEDYILEFAEAVENGSLDQENLSKLQGIHREAQFYWDYVFVENGEGFHNWEKQSGYLDHADKLINEGFDILESL